MNVAPGSRRAVSTARSSHAETTNKISNCATPMRKRSLLTGCAKTRSAPLQRFRPRSRNHRLMGGARSGMRMPSNERLHRGAVGGQSYKSLRQRFETLVRRRSLRLVSQCLLYRRRKLGRQRGFDADERHAGFAMLEPDLDAIRGVRIDHHVKTL